MNDPRRNAIDGDIERSHFFCQRARESFQAGFAGNIVHRAGAAACARRDRRDIDDAPAPQSLHPGYAGPGAQEWSGQVNINDTPPEPLVHRLH